MDDTRVVEPQILHQVSTGKGDGVKVGWRSVVSKGGAGVEDPVATLLAGMHGHTVGVVFVVLESSPNIVIRSEYLRMWVGDSQVVEPDHEVGFS